MGGYILCGCGKMVHVSDWSKHRKQDAPHSH